MDKNNYQDYNQRIECFNKLKFWQELIQITHNEYKMLMHINNKPENNYKFQLDQIENYYNHYKLEFQKCQNIITPQ